MIPPGMPRALLLAKRRKPASAVGSLSWIFREAFSTLNPKEIPAKVAGKLAQNRLCISPFKSVQSDNKVLNPATQRMRA